MESGINAALTVAVVVRNRQNALYKGNIALPTVQNARSMGAREGKTRSFRGFYPPKNSTFMDATVARELMPDCTVRRCTEIAVTFT